MNIKKNKRKATCILSTLRNIRNIIPDKNINKKILHEREITYEFVNFHYSSFNIKWLISRPIKRRLARQSHRFLRRRYFFTNCTEIPSTAISRRRNINPITWTPRNQNENDKRKKNQWNCNHQKLDRWWWRTHRCRKKTVFEPIPTHFFPPFLSSFGISNLFVTKKSYFKALKGADFFINFLSLISTKQVERRTKKKGIKGINMNDKRLPVYVLFIRVLHAIFLLIFQFHPSPPITHSPRALFFLFELISL